MLDFKLLDLIADLIVACEPPPPKSGPGHPRSEIVRVVAPLRRFLREGLPGRSLRAAVEQASGSTLRRFLAYLAEKAVLAKVHALLVAMLRGNPTLILDSCSVRGKRGGDLVGPNPTDRAKMGSKYHIAINGDGVPVGVGSPPPTCQTRSSLSGCFLPPWASWRASARSIPIKAMMPSGTVSSAVPARS